MVCATTFNWIHNVEGIDWFIQNVLAELFNNNHKIRLKLIGKNIPKKFIRYQDIGLVNVGYVPQVQPYYNHSALNISPIFVGGGIRIKILEAMAMKLPVLATSVAAEGIKAKYDDGLIICKNKSEFIDNIEKLISNPKKIDDLGKSAREFVSKNHSWDKNVKVILDNYKQIMKIQV